MKGLQMTNDNEVAGLLQENIEAQNRTTHAVRAFVRFLFIQFVAATIALPLLYFGTILDAPGLVLIAFVVLVVGIVWSSNAGWTELGLSDRLASAREAARALRKAQTETDRGNAAIAREAAAVLRRDARRELFGSKRFRVSGLIGAGITLAAVTVSVVFVLTNEAETAANEAERSGLLENLPETYLRAIDDCAVSAEDGDIDLGLRHQIIDTTLVLRYEFAGVNTDDFVDCVASALTGRGATDLDRGLPQERGDFVLLKGETGASLTIRPTP
jgi:hypothetical protein